MTADSFTNLTAPTLFDLTNATAAAGLPSGSLAQLNVLLTPAGQAAAAGTVTTIFGGTIGAEIVGLTPHNWIAGADGLFHTPTNLAAEWQSLYQQALSGTPLTAIQHLEANAQAVFLNTAINTLSPAVQERDREDAQREFDAISVAMNRIGLSTSMQFTTSDYLAIERNLQSDPQLLELGMQGHGLNSPPEAKYNGYTNDFQNNVDRTTLFIGAGLDNNQNALTDFFDDVIITHLIYPSVPEWNTIEQLNQNGNNEDNLNDTTGATNDSMFNRVFTAADFSQTPGTAGSTATVPPAATPVAGPSQMLGYYNTPVDKVITISNTDLGAGISHVWTVDANGLYQIAASVNLAAEWQADYAIMLNGTAAQKSALTSIQWLEGNIQAIFLNTGFATLSASQLQVDREDIQRQLDAMSAAMASTGVSPHTQLTGVSYVAAGHYLADNADLEELAIQGHGVFGTGLVRYNGFTADMEYVWNGDSSTLYTGGGFDTGTRAVGNLLNDLTLMEFAVTPRNGELKQFDQGGSAGNTLAQTVDGLNAAMFTQVLTKSSFSVPGTSAGTAGTETTVYGTVIPGTMTIGNALLGTTDIWTVNASGQFVTTTNLAAEWQSYYATMLLGHGDTLTSVQRWEGNAEAALEATGLSSSASAATYRMDVQRVIDAASQAMTALGLGGSVLSSANYLALQTYIQTNPALEELAMQGQGLDSPPSAKYNGFVNDFKYSGNSGLSYVGGGFDSGNQAITSFFSDTIIGYLADATYVSGGTTYQMDENAYRVGTVSTLLAALNNTLFNRVYVAADFSTSSGATGPIVAIPGGTTAVAANPVAGAGQILTETGAVISSALTGLAHIWTVDANGVFQTTTDLNLEWYNDYQQALTNPANMTWLQRSEANAEAIFENSSLAQSNERLQEKYRADIQRDLDATWKAMQTAGLSALTGFTQQNYLTLQNTLDSNATLVELASQGLGLGGNWSGPYSGYNGDFRGNAQTVFTGPGYDNGLNSVSHLLSDMIGGDLVFGSMVFVGRPYTLGQNANLNLTLAAAVQDFNTTYTTVLKASNFAIPGASTPTPAVGATSVTAMDGTVLPATIVLNGHTWTADANGEYHTSNLQMEWRGYYQTMLAGNGNTLTAWQRLEGNAEAVLENTGNIWTSEAQEQVYREDVQRVVDAEQTAAKLAGVNMSGPLSVASTLAIENVMHGTSVADEELEEMALQGTGQWGTGLVKYNGFDADMLWSLDNQTQYVGGGMDNGQRAVGSFLGDVIIGGMAYGTVLQNGVLMELNNSGTPSNSVQSMTTALNTMMYRQVLVASDFSQSSSATGAVVLLPGAPSATAAALPTTAASGQVMTAGGVSIANTQTIDGHVWTAGTDGLFHTASLTAEWVSLYNRALAGDTTLTGVQRLEANAEALFLDTGIAKNTNVAQVQSWREDIQRVIDAFAKAETLAGVGANTALTANSLQIVNKTIEGNAVLNEFTLQGFGAGGAASGTRYSGLSTDMFNADWQTTYVGGGYENGSVAVREFLTQGLLSDIGRPTFASSNGGTAFASTASWEPLALSQAVIDMNTYMFQELLKKTDFLT